MRLSCWRNRICCLASSTHCHAGLDPPSGGLGARQSSLMASWIIPERVRSGCKAPTRICLRTSSNVLSGAARQSLAYTSNDPRLELWCPNTKRCSPFAPAFASHDRAVHFRLCDVTLSVTSPAFAKIAFSHLVASLDVTDLMSHFPVFKGAGNTGPL